jgi:single-strand DNA-binding protein
MTLYENNIQLKGFVGKDAETKSAASGNPFTIFSLATKSSYKDKQSGDWISHTEWHRIICFGKPADFAKLLKKGDYAEIEGELRSSEYEAEAANGAKSAKRRSWEIRASRVRKLERPANSESAEPAPEGNAA